MAEISIDEMVNKKGLAVFSLIEEQVKETEDKIDKMQAELNQIRKTIKWAKMLIDAQMKIDKIYP